MTKRDLIEQLEQYPDDTVLYAFDGDANEPTPVTGLLYYPGLSASGPLDDPEPGRLEFQTDEP